jgi:hypothetical protein
MFENTNDLQNKKTEDGDQKPLSSVSVPGAGTEPASYRLPTSISYVKKKRKSRTLSLCYSVPPTGLFSEPFLKDLELIWRVKW